MELYSTVSEERELTEFDITFTNGSVITLAVCEKEGDTVDLTNPTKLIFHIAPKRNPLSDTAPMSDGEDVTIFTNHVFAIQQRKRTIKPITAEEKAAWQKTVTGVINRSI